MGGRELWSFFRQYSTRFDSIIDAKVFKINGAAEGGVVLESSAVSREQVSSFHQLYY
jgi:hypothetical protein